MHVACPCGEQFAVSADRLPCHARCPICQRAFHVANDGAVEFVPNPNPFTVPTECRCGQTFTIHADRFPHRVKCHVCGRHFNVLDTGQAVEFGEPTAHNISTAFQPEPVVPTAGGRSSAIVTEETKDHFGTESDVPTEEDKRLAEVKLIDHMWSLEREQYYLLPFFGLEIIPSKPTAIFFALGVLLIWVFLAAIVIEIGYKGLLCPGVIGAAISVFVPAHYFKLAHEFEKAEAEWQRKRTAAIAKCESLEQDD